MSRMTMDNAKAEADRLEALLELDDEDLGVFSSRMSVLSDDLECDVSLLDSEPVDEEDTILEETATPTTPISQR